mgnify:CR=1 FL=1
MKLNKMALVRLMLLFLVGVMLMGCNSEQANGADEAVVPEIEWIPGQIASNGTIGIVQEGAAVTVTMEANYAYAMIQNVVIPQNAVQARVTIVSVSPGQASGERNLWRLRMTTPEYKVVNVGGGGEAVAGLVETIDLPEPFLSMVQSGQPIPVIELGGAWALGESVTFKLEFLDSFGRSLHFFEQK